MSGTQDAEATKSLLLSIVVFKVRVKKHTAVSLIRSDKQMMPSDVLCQVFSMVDGICHRNFPFVKFHCGPACPAANCPGYQPNYVSQLVEEEQVPRKHVFDVMPGRQGDRISFMYCKNRSFEEELDEWIPKTEKKK